MKKKFLIGASAALLGLATLSSCGQDNALKTVSMFGGTDPHAAAYQSFISEFEKENNIKVKDSSQTSTEEWKSDVLSQFYSGNQPDVLFYFTGQTAKPLVDNNYIVPVDEIRQAYPNYGKNIGEAVADPYCVTLKGFVEGLFVNTELFTDDLAEYATKDTWTWDDFMTICEKLNAKNITPCGLGAIDVPHYWIEHLVLGVNGKQAFTNIPSEAEFTAADGQGSTDADNWIKALQIFKTLADANVFGPTRGAQKNDIASNAFKEGKAAMWLDGSWFAGQVGDETKITQEKVKMMPFPAIPTELGGKNESYMQSGFTTGFYISRKAWDNPEKRDLAVKFVEKMTSTEAITKFCKDAGGVPADNKVKIDGLTPLQESMNTMPQRTVDSTLPLSDSAKAGTFTKLVEKAQGFISGDLAEIKTALVNFAKAQL